MDRREVVDDNREVVEDEDECEDGGRGRPASGVREHDGVKSGSGISWTDCTEVGSCNTRLQSDFFDLNQIFNPFYNYNPLP